MMIDECRARSLRGGRKTDTEGEDPPRRTINPYRSFRDIRPEMGKEGGRGGAESLGRAGSWDRRSLEWEYLLDTQSTSDSIIHRILIYRSPLLLPLLPLSLKIRYILRRVRIISRAIDNSITLRFAGRLLQIIAIKRAIRRRSPRVPRTDFRFADQHSADTKGNRRRRALGRSPSSSPPASPPHRRFS